MNFTKMNICSIASLYKKTSETKTEDNKYSEIYNILPDAITKMQDIGRLDNFCMLI